MWALAQLLPAPAFSVYEVLDYDTQAVVRGGARCASQVLDRGAQAVAACGAAVVREGFTARRAACASRFLHALLVLCAGIFCSARGAAVAREVFYCVRDCLFFSALPLLKKAVCN